MQINKFPQIFQLPQKISSIENVHSFAVNGNNLLVQNTSAELKLSTDMGKSWNNAPIDFVQLADYYALAVDADFIYIAGQYRISHEGQAFGEIKCVYRAKISDVTSIAEDFQSGSNASIFPNPAGDFISLKIPDSSIPAGNQNIEIISPLGIKVLETAFSDRIDISSLARGAYYLKVGGKAYMFVKK